MRRKIAALLMLAATGSTWALAAQAQDHRAPGQPAAPRAQPHVQLASACVQSQQQASELAAQLSRRLESARAAKGATNIRAAMDDLQAALNQMRTALRSCHSAAESTPVARPAGTAPPPQPAPPVDHAAMGHPTPAPQAATLDPQLVTACIQSQREAAVVIERVDRRLEVARQTNGTTEMRAGMEELSAALVEMGASLQKCDPVRTALAAAETAAAMDHSKMPMGGTPGTPGAAAPMDHSKMPMGRTTPAGKPGAAAGARPATPAAPMDHSKMPMAGAAPATEGTPAAIKMDTPKLPVLPAERIPDPACPKNITQPNAPKAVYQRKVYYFCSVADRDQFRKDPVAYLKKHPR